MASFTGSAAIESPRFYGARARGAADRDHRTVGSKLLAHGARREIRVAVCIPLGGLTGIWGPSALASARLAAAELNRSSGIGGRVCRLVTVNADDHAPDLESTLIELAEQGDVDALVGMHTSYVRQRIVSAVGGQLPYVYTPLYEGGENTPGVFTLGETPARQLQPAIAWLAQHERPRRFALVGNDYIWPHVSNRLARGYIRQAGAEVVAEHYVALGTTDFGAVLASLRRTRADAVLMSLVGEDAIEFNRAFARDGLARAALRLSGAIEENELLAIGADSTERLYVASSYFAALGTEANIAFKERYHQHFGERAPTLNSLGQSTYEGVHFLASLFDRGLAESARWAEVGRGEPVAYRSARGGAYAGDGLNLAPVYLAEAAGHVFRVITRL